jgi:hypothetical protein
VFSMDGEICPLPELIQIKRDFGCLLMIDGSDEAISSAGVMGNPAEEKVVFETFLAADPMLRPWGLRLDPPRLRLW